MFTLKNEERMFGSKQQKSHQSCSASVVGGGGSSAFPSSSAEIRPEGHEGCLLTRFTRNEVTCHYV